MLLAYFEGTLVFKLLEDVDNDNDSVFTTINKTANESILMELLLFLSTKIENSKLKIMQSLQNNQNLSFLDQERSFEDEALLNKVTDFISNLDKK